MLIVFSKFFGANNNLINYNAIAQDGNERFLIW